MNEKYNNLIKQRDKAEKKIEQADFKGRWLCISTRDCLNSFLYRIILKNAPMLLVYRAEENLSVNLA